MGPEAVCLLSGALSVIAANRRLRSNDRFDPIGAALVLSAMNITPLALPGRWRTSTSPRSSGNAWFALYESAPVTFFAGLWTS